MPLPHIAYFILDENKKVKFEPDIVAWAKWMQDHQAEIVVKQDKIGASLVSTAFIGIDGIFSLNNARVFETLVFGIAEAGPVKSATYKTYEQALKGHAEFVAAILNSVNN